ncbi:MAG: YHS domain protein [Nitrospina sp.]|jgi:YHS domain-containing protein|nr:YHS domain protein [Nitrospina sp.]MBT3509334.1 YHS domain protein [Nitrospina sp.]MBT3876128.1 YHS domain protein [Nitrospina sp.]MBT4048885.1 YHS domain protein [Nitrospina sp.]MBT4557594.1 YHS domain protein [Nitrospina sp.]
MKAVFKRGSRFFAVVSLLVALFANGALANTNNGTEISAPVMSGYDPVAYFEAGKPVRGNGYHTATYNGGTYLFETKEHKEAFNANPKKYAPQFGGYCAYGVAVGKKFYSDPTVWKIINRKLYLNLDTNIQAKWNKKMKAYISKAHSNWEGIEHKHPSEL